MKQRYEYPTAGTPSAKTIVDLEREGNLRTVAWRCQNCQARSGQVPMKGPDDHETVNQIRREAKGHAEACDL
ncbi:hypothetical protein ACFYUY_01450 [Kitasatospora sp. NPDC004745]|uniref:hypothetical protein n=1 Tax=Kitasatospora sp. NPDC004745 TaxID=3364019 RepID=UPI0036BA15B5